MLIQHLQKGDEHAYAYLMDKYYQRLCVYAKSLCHDIYLAEDIVQNIFLAVWERRKKLKDIYPIKSYLYQCVCNEFINQYRKKSNLLALEKEYMTTLNTIIKEEDSNNLAQLITLVEEEIQNLPPKCKVIFTLAKMEGLTYTEIAEHLNISFRTVENQISKAFTLIREKAGSKINSILFLIFGTYDRVKINLLSTKPKIIR